MNLLKTLSLLIAIAFTTAALAGEPVVVKSGTMVNCELQQTVSTKKSKLGDNVEFIILDDLKVGGKVVVKAGTKVVGKISKLDEPGLAGIPGKISVTPVSVTAVDGTVIYFSESNISNKGKQKFGALVKGGHAIVEAGVMVQAFVATDVEIVVE